MVHHASFQQPLTALLHTDIHSSYIPHMKTRRLSITTCLFGAFLAFHPASGQDTLPGSQPKMPASAPNTPEAQKEAARLALYPRSKSDIRKQLKLIAARKAPAGIAPDVQAAVNTLNAYRYLSGLYSEVAADSEFNTQAQEAARVCAQNNKIAHDLGGHTESCNLFAGKGTLTNSMHVYMNDPGDNNREERGHRRNSLSYNLDKVGFGQKGDYSAMRVFGKGSRNERAEQGWSYPGRGYYPKEWMLGNGWSYYPPDGISLGKETKVTMWKVTSSPKAALPAGTEPKGRKIAVAQTYAHPRNLVFEPQLPANAKGKGIYWVRIESEDFTDQYVVELY